MRALSSVAALAALIGSGLPTAVTPLPRGPGSRRFSERRERLSHYADDVVDAQKGLTTKQLEKAHKLYRTWKVKHPGVNYAAFLRRVKAGEVA